MDMAATRFDSHVVSCSGIVQAFVAEQRSEGPHSPVAFCTHAPPSPCSTWDESIVPTDSSLHSSASSLCPPAFGFPTLVCAPVKSAASQPILYGHPIQWRGCAGLHAGMSKPHALSPSCVTMTPDTAKIVTLVAKSVSPLASASHPIRFHDVCVFRGPGGTFLKATRSGHVGQTRHRSKASVFRIVPPVADGDVVHAEDDVCFQVDGQCCGQPGQWLWLTAATNGSIVLSSDAAPVVLGLHHGHAAPPTSSLSTLEPLTVRGLVYNIWCLPPLATSVLNLSPHKRERMAAIPAVLPPDLDFVVFCEAFDDRAKQDLTTAMKRHGFLYETTIAGGRTKFKLFHSGVFVMSKYPLANTDQLVYGSTAIGVERMVDKAAMYVQMIKDNQAVHIFATHTQAWDDRAAIKCRAKQIEMLATWMQSKHIPPHDIVVVAGDLNVDQYAVPCTEYDWMTATLGVESPAAVDNTPKYSFDPISNVLASSGMSSGGKAERLDYVMTSTRHRQPTSSATQVLPVKAKQGWVDDHGAWITDLSDHYPVMSEFHFD
ncbi:hypothetical protein DYB32_006074 [Aphanomyces invadans]|uniref:sphingomyelin phosphodiesterase n=1 Tax=Aphanomyces invadans TaxID=157072 RepID=A0A3R6V948_9STRA|nr:hypothetical protein DYB32_006074 [Aphanomyces invadans]